MKERVIFLGLFVLVSYFFVNMHNNTYSLSYDIDKSVLFYDEDNIKLENNIKEYLDVVDNYIMPNSSFEMSYYLNENYDFLVWFAMDYVLGNYEYYSDMIIEKDNDKYIKIEELYEITDRYFGVRDFYIILDNVNIDGEYIELVDYNLEEFKLSIISVNVFSSSNGVNAIVLYENDVKYSYWFEIVDGVLKIRNIEVL